MNESLAFIIVVEWSLRATPCVRSFCKAKQFTFNIFAPCRRSVVCREYMYKTIFLTFREHKKVVKTYHLEIKKERAREREGATLKENFDHYYYFALVKSLYYF